MHTGRKGFIHIVEIVVISLSVLLLVHTISSLPKPTAQWEEESLRILASDMLFTLDAKGSDWLDGRQVQKDIAAILDGTSISYQVTVRNVPKRTLSVSCYCSESEAAMASAALQPFALLGRQFAATVNRTTNPFGPGYDVAVLGQDGIGLAPEAERFLQAGKGVVIIANLRKEDLAQGLGRLLAADWNGTAPIAGLPARLQPAANSRYYNIVKYFRHASSLYLGDSLDAHFSGERLHPADNDTERIILAQESGAIAALANPVGKGRAAWLLPSSEQNRLLRSLVLWASGESMVFGARVPDPVAVAMLTSVEQDGLFQPLAVELQLGYLFQD